LIVAAVGLIQLRLRHVPFYVDEVRAGINYFVAQKGKKAICAMYQDTDFGKRCWTARRCRSTP
jgi:hypothetical protein